MLYAIPRHVEFISRYDIFRIIVANLFQRSEFTPARIFTSDDIAHLDIYDLPGFPAHEVHFSGIEDPHIHFIAKEAKMLVHDVLDNFLNARIQRARSPEVTETDIIPINLLIGFEDLLAMNIVTLHDIEQESLGIVAAIKENQVGGDILLL